MRARFNPASVLSCVAAAAVAFAASTTSYAATLATWTFETSVPTTAGPLTPEVGTGAGLGFHAATSAYSNPVGNGSAESFSSTAWAIGDYYQFSTATTGETSFIVSWDQISSGTGPKDFLIQYSTDGSTFTTIDSYAVLVNGGATTWGSATPVPASSYSESITIAPATTIYFRMTNSTTVSAAGGTTASGGTNRIDNVKIESVPIPEPATLALAGFGLIGCVAARRRR